MWHDVEKIFWLFSRVVVAITVMVIVTLYVVVRVNFSLPSAIPKYNP